MGSGDITDVLEGDVWRRNTDGTIVIAGAVLPSLDGHGRDVGWATPDGTREGVCGEARFMVRYTLLARET